MRLFKGFKVYIYIIGVIFSTFQLQIIVRSHFYLQNPFGVVLKIQGLMLELS